MRMNPIFKAGVINAYKHYGVAAVARSFTSSTKDVLERLHLIPTASLCDADKNLSSSSNAEKRIRVISSSIHSLNLPRKLVGIARTVQCSTRNDFLAVLRGLQESKAGEVLMVNTLDSDCAVAGELFVTEAERCLLNGLVIDGPMRDMSCVKSSSVPCFASMVTPYSGTVSDPGRMQVDIMCGGVIVSPGDVVVGDEDGLVIGSVNAFLNVIDLAQDICKAEEKIVQIMKETGKPLHDLTNYDQHLQKRLNDQQSNLEFRIPDS